VQSLFHSSGQFTYPSLVTFLLAYLLLHCVTYGALIPCGVFVPCLLLGTNGGSRGRVLLGGVSWLWWWWSHAAAAAAAAAAAGSTYGRVVGGLFAHWWPSLQLDQGVFALLGAASMIAGVTRMTIALTCARPFSWFAGSADCANCVRCSAIVLEASNNISFGVPVLLVVLVAKWVGDIFNMVRRAATAWAGELWRR
jgi:H+/Cl- antiporter ClcA